jgi:hypothetical protein
VDAVVLAAADAAEIAADVNQQFATGELLIPNYFNKESHGESRGFFVSNCSP